MHSKSPYSLVKSVSFDGKMKILWKDNTTSLFSYWDLRNCCTCASCVDELSGKKILDEMTIPLDIRPISSEYVGNYGLKIKWSDGHDTGIYPFQVLKADYFQIASIDILSSLK